MAGVETTPRTGEAVESEESSSSSSSSSEECSSFEIAVVIGVAGVEISVVASFATETVAAVVAAAAVLAAGGREDREKSRGGGKDRPEKKDRLRERIHRDPEHLMEPQKRRERHHAV